MIQEKPWFVDMANYNVVRFVQEDLNWQQNKKFLKETKQYVWNDPYLFEIGVGHLLRRRVSNKEAQSIIYHYHNSTEDTTIENT